MSRYVVAPVHNELWRECYRSIRRAFPNAPVIIIDDHSNMTLVDQGFEMVSATVIASDLDPGKGEVLPYYYFHKLQPFRKAVLLADGMFILKGEPLSTAIARTDDWRFLWHFTRDHHYALDVQQSLMDTLRPETHAPLRALQSNETQWVGCFAAASIVSWEFLHHLEERYGFFNMIGAIHTRTDRMALERLVALLAIEATTMPPIESVSVYGDIHDHRRCFDYRWDDYLRDRDAGALADDSAVKVWNGR